jgi:formylglycine-generating enzyme required for sulfatase activity
LLEETPLLDTIEARRTGRLIAGSIATLVILLGTFIGYRLLTARPHKDDSSDGDKIEVVDIHKVRLRNENEAAALLERARAVDRSGNHPLAHRLLTRLSSAYPETKAADAAREALGRWTQNRPHFSDSPRPDAAAAGESPPAPPGDPGVVTAVDAPRWNSPGAAGVNAPSPAAPPVATHPELALAANTPAPTARGGAVPPIAPEAASAGTSPAPAAPATPPVPARTLPAGFQARSGAGIDPSGWPVEVVCSRDGAMMVLVPGGPYVMGRDGADPAEAPSHLTRVSTFYIDKHEVTNRQFELFLRDAGARSDRSQALARDGGRVSVSEDFPAAMVSAKDARDYAEWAGKRLPTEAQWEKAARGTDGRLYPWGAEPPAWVRPRVPLQVDAVMTYPIDLSPYGAYDMAGNVMEWTRDWYDSAAYAIYRGTAAEDPTGPSSRPPTNQVAVRGGSRQWIITAREGMPEGSRLPYLGFRCMLPVEGPDTIVSPADPARPGAKPAATAKKGAVPF